MSQTKETPTASRAVALEIVGTWKYEDENGEEMREWKKGKKGVSFGINFSCSIIESPKQVDCPTQIM